MIFKKVKTGNKRKIYLLGIKILSYKSAKGHPQNTKNLTPAKSLERISQSFNLETNDLTKKNQSLKNSAQKKRCFVLATGASIKQQNLKLLAGEDCYSISNFFLHEDLNIIKPKFHFFAPYHEPLILENYIEWMNLADKTLPKETEMFLCDSNEYLVKQYNLFKNRKIHYLHFGPVDMPVNTDITKTIKAPQTGPIMMLPVMEYLGYKEIYLVGQDMNRLAYYGGTTPNFYTHDPRQNATNGNQWVDIIPELERTLIMFRQFNEYADYFKKREIEFYNLSPNSWLSFIAKKDFNEILKAHISN